MNSSTFFVFWWRQKKKICFIFVLPLSLSVIWKIPTNEEVWCLWPPASNPGLGSPWHTTAPVSPKHYFPAFTALQTRRPVVEPPPFSSVGTKVRDTSDSVPIVSVCVSVCVHLFSQHNACGCDVYFMLCWLSGCASTSQQPSNINTAAAYFPYQGSGASPNLPGRDARPPSRYHLLACVSSRLLAPRRHPLHTHLLVPILFCLKASFVFLISFSPLCLFLLITHFSSDCSPKTEKRGEGEPENSSSIPLMFWGNTGSFGRQRGNAWL